MALHIPGSPGHRIDTTARFPAYYVLRPTTGSNLCYAILEFLGYRLVLVESNRRYSLSISSEWFPYAYISGGSFSCNSILSLGCSISCKLCPQSSCKACSLSSRGRESSYISCKPVFVGDSPFANSGTALREALWAFLRFLRIMNTLISETSRTIQPPTVPPAIAPL